jgi:hypothetical protein
MDEKIGASEFYDIIENKAQIWMLNENFKKNNQEFYELMKNAQDSVLVFDKIECKKNLEGYVSSNLINKIHTVELIDCREKIITSY